jgi:hypothetical protein
MRRAAQMILDVTREGLPNQTRQPTPGGRLGFKRTPLARRGCALRSVQDADRSRREWPGGALNGHDKPAQGKRAARRASPWVRETKRHVRPVGAGQTDRRRMGSGRLEERIEMVDEAARGVCFAPSGRVNLGGMQPRATPLPESGLALGWRVSPLWG